MNSRKRFKVAGASSISILAMIAILYAFQASLAPLGGALREASSDGAPIKSSGRPFPRGTSSSIMAKAYSQYAPLKPQMSLFRHENGPKDKYAACVLSRALLLCKQRDDDDEEYGFPTYRYSSAYLASIDADEMDRLARVVAERKTLIASSCADMQEVDLRDFDDSLYRAAVLGDPASMRLFALQTDKTTAFGESRPVRIEHVDRHRKFAESMLNRAADTGDPAAIKAIHSVYASGGINTPIGNVQVRPDLVKSAAAYLALVSVDDYYLKSTLRPDDFAMAEETLDALLSRFGEAEQIRLAKLQNHYIEAYKANHRPKNMAEALTESFPEQGCSAYLSAATMPGR